MTSERLREDFKAAMKAKDAFGLGILRMVMSAMSNLQIEKRSKGLPEELTEEDVMGVLSKESKKRLDSVQQFTEGGREDLAEGERKEAEFIAKYLPAQMTKEEIALVVDAVIARSASREFGAVMKEAMAEMRGKADGKAVGDAVKEKLG